ncbi:proline-rich Akt substrate 40 kDa [Arctopsyche grandis]|uniref:proline-rich Akt substrate 40 kDa n=1 Tax=Arctopsyche grandis TaxID=121162 RepID=UPI00406DA133
MSVLQCRCRCLNVTLSGVPLLAETSPQLLDAPPSHAFPCQRLGFVDNCNVCCQEPTLLEARKVDSWMVYRCLVCSTYTHASHVNPPHRILLNLSLVTSNEEMASLRNGDTYSPMFKIILSEASEDPPTKRPPSMLSHSAMGNLSKRLTRELQCRLEDVEEEIRMFREKKYIEFEEFKERAHQDFKIITNILSQDNANPIVTEAAQHIQLYDTDNPMPIEKSIVNSKKQHTSTRANPVSFSKPKNTIVKNLVNIGDYKEDSLDSEGIFDLEGMDSSTPPHIDHNSDAYDSDTDDSVSRDEGIHCARLSNQQYKMSIAKSLPVNVPVFGQFHEHSQELTNQNLEEQPQNIAASIKALARSVHGDVFGDLPRPRFSTQI